MNREYVPTTEEVLRYIKKSHREYLFKVEREYKQWLKNNPIQPKSRSKPKPSKPIKKTEGDIIIDFEN